MYSINGREEIKGFGDIPVVTQEGTPMTIGGVLEQYVGSWMAENKDEVFSAMAVGLKIHAANQDKQPILLEDVEMELVKKTLKQIKHPVVVMNAVFRAVEAVNRVDKDA